MTRTFALTCLSLFLLPISAMAQTDEPQPDKPTTETQEDTTAESIGKALGFRQIFGEDMMAAYENKIMEGVYKEYALDIAAGRPPTTFTETHHDNATTTYNHRAPEKEYTIKGIYTVQKDTICYYYNNPEVSGKFCFFVFLNDSCYFHYFAPPSVPLSDSLPKTEEDFDNWTSMAYSKKDAGTCLPSIS